MSSIRIGKRQILPITIVALLITIIVLTLNAGHIKNQLNAWKLLPQPERLTELYYTDHTKLPTTYLPGLTQQFAFDTHNLEYQTTDYNYAVSQESEDGSQKIPIKTGTFSLKQDEYQTETVSFSPADQGRRIRVVTSLTNKTTNQTQSIHYWITNLAPTEGAGV